MGTIFQFGRYLRSTSESHALNAVMYHATRGTQTESTGTRAAALIESGEKYITFNRIWGVMGGGGGMMGCSDGMFRWRK